MRATQPPVKQEIPASDCRKSFDPGSEGKVNSEPEEEDVPEQMDCPPAVDAVREEFAVRPLGLYGKLAKIAGELTWVEKTGRNEAQNYNYVTAENVADAVRGKLSTYGIACIPEAMETRVRASATGKQQITTVKMRYTLVDSETGQTHMSDWYGEGADSSDKGLSKAYTGALKYFWIDLFQIPTGKDPDAAEAQRQSRSTRSGDDKLSAAGRKKVIDAVKANATDEEWTLFRSSLGIPDDESLTRGHAQKVREWLDKKTKA